MNESLFVAWLATHYPGITLSVVARINDTTNPLTYLHKTMLREELSVSGRWESINTANTFVMADVVAMDSPLPLKKRDSISKASGDITKLGLEMSLNERQLSDLDTLVATGGTDEQILVKLFQDLPKVIVGVYERVEEMFLQALSSGVTLIDDPENVGTGIRVDYGYLAANKFGVAALWSDKVNARPFDDLDRLVEKATTDGSPLTTIHMDKATFRRMAATNQAKELFAFSQSFVGSTIPTPSLPQVNAVLSDRLNMTIELIDRTMRYEKNGVQTIVRPWETGKVIAHGGGQVGILSYAPLAESKRPVAGVSYQTVENKILVKKYSVNRPSLKEFTASESRQIPVITNVDQIYSLDTLVIQL